MLARAAKPKLSLAVPAATTTTHGAPKSPFPLPTSPSAINSPTARNTILNQRGFSTYQQPTFSYAKPSDTKSILKKAHSINSARSKKIQFKDEPTITCLTPLPEDYYGTYVKMSRDEKQWGRAK
ncbi:hypothetical protein MMC06_000199 [Schaereria dolodes]|nr:hypothetical protein [Schaereria dolodes]